MARLIYSAIASLDGYVEDTAGAFDWSAADDEVHAFVNDLEAFDSDSYRNELGVDAKAHHLESIIAVLQGAGFAAEAWYGVRVFTDPAPADQPLDDTNELDVLLRAEEEAGRRDPYRWLASQIHLLARRASAE